MRNDERNDIGLNRTGVMLTVVGLGATSTMTVLNLPWVLVAVPVLVTVSGILLCTRSIWQRR